MSVEAPERIWVERDPDTGEKRWFSIKGMGDTEYVRADKLEELAAALAEAKRENEALREALEDAMAGMRYVRQVYGDLVGVGFNRVEERGRKALARNAGGKDDK